LGSKLGKKIAFNFVTTWGISLLDICTSQLVKYQFVPHFLLAFEKVIESEQCQGMSKMSTKLEILGAGVEDKQPRVEGETFPSNDLSQPKAPDTHIEASP
jgi:hypothetical protein